MKNNLSTIEEVQEIAILFGNQAKLAKAFGLGRSTISMWKRNGIPPSRRLQLVEVADELGIKLPEWVVPRQRFRPARRRNCTTTCHR